jgi:hypothetical protein
VTIRVRPSIEKLLADHEAVDAAMAEAVREAIVRHERLRQSIVVWRDGKVVEIPPEEIPGTASSRPKVSVLARWQHLRNIAGLH